MITVDEAKRIVFEQIRPLAPVPMPIDEALGLVLAEDVRSAQDLPPFDNSAMDGFALRTIDQGAFPTLKVVGELAAGSIFEDELHPGEALRIMTGAPLPAGADAVLKFEDSESGPEFVRAKVSLRSGENVRRSGEDISKGMLVLCEGLVLRPAHLGVLASLGIAKILVHPRPRVAILSTGNEVVEVDSSVQPGQIRDSNSTILSALVREAGGIPVRLGIARDTREEIEKKFEEAKNCDVFVSSGGVSMGDYDFVGETAREKGEIFFDSVAQQPGKPFTFGKIGGTIFFGLPGNPVSSMVTFALYLRPAIRRLLGHGESQASTKKLKLAERIERSQSRRQFLRAVEEDGVARLTGPQGSGILRSMAIADSLLVIPEGEGHLEAGTLVEAIEL